MRCPRLTCSGLLALALAGCGPRVQPPAPEGQALAALQARCEQDMLRQVCRVTTGGTATATPDPTAVVFVAGVGVVDATAYAELQAAGPAMCRTVVEACRQDWRGTRCTASRALFGGAGS